MLNAAGATGRGAVGTGRRGERRGAPELGGGGVRAASLPPRGSAADTAPTDLSAASSGEI